MILSVILLCTLPLTEIPIDYYMDWVKKRTNQHTLTMLLRWIIMALTSIGIYLFKVAPVISSAFVALSFHFLAFGPLYNKIVMKQPLSYLSEKVWWDRKELLVRTKIGEPAIWIIKSALFIASLFNFFWNH